MANDWDFSDAGRARKTCPSIRCYNAEDETGIFLWKNKTINADFEKKLHGRYVVCDFVCPTKETRENFSADIVIWMDTIKEGRYEDTNKLFQDPEKLIFISKSGMNTIMMTLQRRY